MKVGSLVVAPVGAVAALLALYSFSCEPSPEDLREGQEQLKEVLVDRFDRLGEALRIKSQVNEGQVDLAGLREEFPAGFLLGYSDGKMDQYYSPPPRHIAFGAEEPQVRITERQVKATAPSVCFRAAPKRECVWMPRRTATMPRPNGKIGLGAFFYPRSEGGRVGVVQVARIVADTDEGVTWVFGFYESTPDAYFDQLIELSRSRSK